jgi:hypothetical protein
MRKGERMEGGWIIAAVVDSFGYRTMLGQWSKIPYALRRRRSRVLEGDEEEDYAPDDNTDFTHAPSGSVYFGESVENLLLTRTGRDGTMYKDPNARI